MKKTVSVLLSVVFIVCLTLSFSAVPASRMIAPSAAGTNMPEADYHILKIAAAPEIDGKFDGESVWGDPIIDVMGEDAYWYTVNQEKFQARYPSWAKTGLNLWEKTDGSVEFMRNIRLRVYVRWDDDRLYFAFVVEGNIQHDENGAAVFYDNQDAMWFGNNVEITLGPENPKLNYSSTAADPDFDGKYEPGYVGNEYLFAITDSAKGKALGKISLGRYDDGLPGTKMWVSEEYGSEIAALNDPSVDTGLQVYEMALPFDLTHCSVSQGLSEEKGGKGGIPFTCAINAQCGDEYSQASLQGFQIGSGLFYRNPPEIFNSTKLILEDSLWICPGHTGGEHLKNCSAKAKCTLCDERYGDFGDHDYSLEINGNDFCVYCKQCQVHVLDEDGHCKNCDYVQVKADEVLVGDLNGDGMVNSADAALMNRYAAKWDITGAVNANKENYMDFFSTFADTNGDGDMNSADAAQMNRYAAKWIMPEGCRINTLVEVKR